MITEAHGSERHEGKQVQRYKIFGEIASGGMATVHLGRLTGPAGFSRIVAMKHLHPHFSNDPTFRAMLIDEAWLAARIHHPNVVPTLDVLVEDGDIFLVMDYVHGEPLDVLRRAAEKLGRPPTFPICSAILVGALQGLHAAHDARAETGHRLQLVHRDVSPQNIIVSADGVPMVIDFGVAKAMQAHEETRPGVIKGKSGYMAPEQIRGEEVTRAADIFAASVVLWELLTSRRLFGGGTELERMNRVLLGTGVVPPSRIVAGVPAELDAVVMRGLRPDPKQRYQTALEMSDALERAIPPASQRHLAAWVRFISAESLRRRADLLKGIELSAVTTPAASEFEVEAVTVVSHAHAGEAGGDLAPGSPPASRATEAIWSDWRILLGAGVAALLLLLLLVSEGSRSRRQRARLAAMTASPARVASRPPPAVVAESSPPSLQPEVEAQAPAQEEPAAPAEPSGSRSGDGEAQRPRRWSSATTRRSLRDRLAAFRRSAAPSKELAAPSRDLDIADRAAPSPLAPAADPGPSTPATGDPKGRVPLVDDPPHMPLLE